MERGSSFVKPMRKDRENRQANKRDLVFHHYTITPTTAHTALVILESLEPEVLCTNLRAIAKFVGQDMDNLELIFEMGGVDCILPLIQRPQVNVQRFALKVLSHLSNLPQGPEAILKYPNDVQTLCTFIKTSEDLFISEFAAMILSEITKEFEGCDQVVEANIIQSLFHKMANCEDPDVKKNCLQTVYNLLADPGTSDYVAKSKYLQWDVILTLMRNKYPAIQKLAIETLQNLINRSKDQELQKAFRKTTGLADLVDLLETYDWRDIHHLVLQVIRDYVRTEDGALHTYESGAVDRILSYLDVALPEIKPYCLAVLAELCKTNNGRVAMHELDIDLVLCNALTTEGFESLGDAALGIAYMTKLYASACKMAKTNVVESLSSILSDDMAAWFDVRLNCLKALGELCKRQSLSAQAIVDPKNFIHLRNVINDSDVAGYETPIEARLRTLSCCINLLTFQVSTEALTETTFISDLLELLQNKSHDLKATVLELLCGLTVNQNGRIIFEKLNGEKRLCEMLHVDNFGVRTAACRLIQLTVTHETSVKYLSVLPFMLQKKNIRHMCPAWEVAIEQILNKHPSAKLAFTSALEINDFTMVCKAQTLDSLSGPSTEISQESKLLLPKSDKSDQLDNFYVMKRLRCCFPILCNLVEMPCSPMQPAFLCNFQPRPASTASEARQIIGDGASDGIHPSQTIQKDRLDDKPRYDCTLDDPCLRKYLSTLQECFGIRAKLPENMIDTGVEHRAKRLAIFVARQMCGLSIDKECSNPSIDLHLNELKLALKSNLIPIGYIRIGGLLERAVLYKVLADRLDIPCGLTRMSSAHAWVEVAIPEPENREGPVPQETYPAFYLRPNYVVDLMYRPGNLMRIGSVEADRYTGSPHCEPYVLNLCSGDCHNA